MFNSKDEAEIRRLLDKPLGAWIKSLKESPYGSCAVYLQDPETKLPIPFFAITIHPQLIETIQTSKPSNPLNN